MRVALAALLVKKIRTCHTIDVQSCSSSVSQCSSMSSICSSGSSSSSSSSSGNGCSSGSRVEAITDMHVTLC